MNLASMSPADIDTAIAAIWARAYKVQDRLDDTVAQLTRMAALNERVAQTTNRARHGYSPEDITAVEARITALGTQYRTILSETAPFEAEFTRRGGWSRAYLVNNTNGHVHRSMHCSTCFPTTRFLWLTQMSDHAETEIVDAAGEKACTTCYPSAPVDVLKRPSRFLTDDERSRAERKADRDAKRAAAQAAEIHVPGYQDDFSRSGARGRTFKTARALTNAIAEQLSSLTWYGTGHPSAGKWAANIVAGREALSEAGVTYDYDKALAAARKKVTREGGQVKF